ncbi:MAG: AraC family transcriptional regulator ligand-binding domain-containing protein [Burkholderiaceae bacterium]|nr:AraC family transcriptional regulator ligand-binding domain-containing protein [Burkholderiaceae bacterium]
MATSQAPRVIGPYAQTLWDQALLEGRTLQEVQDIAQCDAPGEDDMPRERYLALLKLAVDRTAPGFGWRLGRSVKPTTYGVNGILLLACPDLGAALAQVLRFESLVHDLGRSSLQSQGERVTYRWRSHCADHAASAALSESVFAGVLSCAEWLAGQAMHGLQLELAEPEPRGSGAYSGTAEWPGARAQIRWGMRQSAHWDASDQFVCSFPSELLAIKLPQNNTSLLPMLQAHAEALLRARESVEEHAVVGQVRRAILSHLGHSGAVRLERIAQDLHVSARTLQRRLNEAGISFQDLLDRTRHALAQHYLQNTPISIGELAHLLGFNDSAAFSNAFREWQGMAPALWRDTLYKP